MDTTQPIQKPRTTAADFFLHLGVIVALYVTVISFLNLVFSLINYVYPNLPLEQGVPTSDLSIPVSALVIFAPLYIFLSWLLNKQYGANPYKRELGVRKWLVYLTLFISGLAIAIDLVVLVYSFVSGELITLGFLLKVLSVFIVLVSVFWYHIADLKDKINTLQNKKLAIALSVVIIGFICLSFAIMGSPFKQRLLKIDSRRVSDLQNIQYQVLNYWQSKEKLPASLDDLVDSLSYNKVPVDPATQSQYEYRAIPPFSFELCATFDLPSEESVKSIARPEFSGDYEFENWKHEKGRTCFERTIDPDRYPPYTKVR